MLLYTYSYLSYGLSIDSRCRQNQDQPMRNTPLGKLLRLMRVAYNLRDMSPTLFTFLGTAVSHPAQAGHTHTLLID